MGARPRITAADLAAKGIRTTNGGRDKAMFEKIAKPQGRPTNSVAPNSGALDPNGNPRAGAVTTPAAAGPGPLAQMAQRVRKRLQAKDGPILGALGSKTLLGE